MNKASERYSTKVEIPISVILETIFSSDNKDVETLCRYARKYSFVDFEDNCYKLQDDYRKQDYYIWLSKKERKQYDYEDYLLNENEKLQKRINKAIEYIDDMCLCSSGYCEYGDDLSPKHIVDILKGVNDD